VVTVTLGAMSLRVATSARELAARPIPGGDIQSLAGFLAPLPDSAGFAHGGNLSTVVSRDPFLPTGYSRPQGSDSVVWLSQPAPRGTEQWVVSSILVEGSRKSAIVNDAWVSVGDPLGGGSRLTSVERDHIVVTDANGIRHVVSIRGGES
jgi:hypothetical protein